MNHTPGPWKVSESSHQREEGGPEYYEISGPDQYDTYFVEHDAHLIAAAPELLAACRFFVDHLPKTDEINWKWRFDLIEQKIRAAIERAEGK